MPGEGFPRLLGYRLLARLKNWVSYHSNHNKTVSYILSFVNNNLSYMLWTPRNVTKIVIIGLSRFYF